MVPRLLILLVILLIALAPAAAASDDAIVAVKTCPGEDPTCLVVCGGHTLADTIADPRGTAEDCLPA